MFTIKKSFALHGRGSHHKGSHEATDAVRKINTGKRLIDLEWPWLSGLCVDMAPVVKAECHIAVLLNLKDNNIATQGVNRSSRNEYAVAWLRNDAHEVVRDGPVGKRIPQIAGSRTRFQARIDAASFICLNHDPRFGLPGFPRWNQVWVRIAGMHLHRKHLACIKKLEEQRKATEARSQLTHQLPTEFFPQLTDSLPLS